MRTAADQVRELIFGRWRNQILLAGTELAVFDHLDKRMPKTVNTLAHDLDADPTLLCRVHQDPVQHSEGIRRAGTRLCYRAHRARA